MEAGREIIFVLGGARSGKTRRALEIGKELAPPGPRVYIATARAVDEEMAERIKRHREERGAEWETVEEELHLGRAVEEASKGASVVLADCIGIWISNLLEQGTEMLEREEGELFRALMAPGPPVILVSSETGLGIVPESPLARAFRDRLGLLNQRLASLASKAEFIAAGLPITLK